MRKKLISCLILLAIALPIVSFSDENLDSTTSPNGRWIAYVRRSHHIMPELCVDMTNLNPPYYANEIWIQDKKTMKERLLVPDNFSCDSSEYVIVDLENLQFSPDNKMLYFQTSSRPASGAIHAVNIKTGHQWFVADGNDYYVLMHGQYKGNLVINQHRYRYEGGSYNWNWLYKPSGEEIKLYKKEEN